MLLLNTNYFTFVARHQTHLPLSKQSEHEYLFEQGIGHASIDTTPSDNLEKNIYTQRIKISNGIY